MLLPFRNSKRTRKVDAPPDLSVDNFLAEYKLRILRLADSCTDPGSLGRLLRKEGLYSSNLTT